ncbi:hypothetical protein F5X68DRAFT_197903 [Plectosphaerella plurivora]|uniref:DUF7707 domain-containing protein n=1 Tax=Plectosphaerella plurivora TaxID=936078 RepID=A0A9P9AF98_9PEZI|nr:hypothetical protein F5X68DRAFT_197903 [Plectosphaerella plurivora]
MRAFAVLAVAFATAAVAQSSTNSSKVYSVEDLGPIFSTLSDNDKRDMCRGQLNGCENLCGGRNSWETNDCNDQTLVYECKCSDGQVPALQDYTNTMPSQICLRVYNNCIETHPNDRDGQEECIKAREASCDENKLQDPAEANTGSGSNTSSAATTATSAASSDSTGEPSTTASADAADATAATTSSDNFAAPTAVPMAGAAAVAMMVAYLV